MSRDVDGRLRADGEHWRGAEASRASISLQTALAAAVPERDKNGTAVFEVAPAPPPLRPATCRRWVWAAVAAAVVVLAGTAAAVIGTSRHSDRHATGTTAAAVLAGTSWLAPGVGNNGNGTTVSFDPAATKLTVTDGCITAPYHVIVERGTLRIGSIDCMGITCGGVARDPGLYPAAGDPSVAAQNALDAVLQGTVSWTIDKRELVLRRGAKTVTLYATDSIAQVCAATEFTVTAAGAAHRYPLGAKSPTLTVKAPAELDAAATGPCRAAVTVTLARANKPLAWIKHSRYRQWKAIQTGIYRLTFTLRVCTVFNDCSLGFHPLPISVHVIS